ncbi:MAG: methyltransferase domain-containing protein [Betaproteobacteria bacterium]|nr:methyltransferase domain-containing protein [Betaproteobacteria bacterium]
MENGWLEKSLPHYEAGRWAEAALALEHSLIDEPGNAAAAAYRLGNVRGEQGRDSDALACFERSLALDPSNAKTWNNLGAVRQRLGSLDEARTAYRTAIDRDPELFEPYLNLGRLGEVVGDLAGAASYLSAGLSRHPGHPMLVHLLSAATGENTAHAPRDHIVAYFDGFAPAFDRHLENGLAYRVPARLAQMVSPSLRPPCRVLDLGCGTGLMGAAVADPGVELVGIDLSPRMLELAERRGVYSRLILGDATEELGRAASGSFNAVLAADVFIYIGDLTELFRGVARVLAPGGTFCFSIEDLSEGSYRLQSNGRYAHALAHVRELAAGTGFAERSARAVDLRGDKSGYARGHLLRLERR